MYLTIEKLKITEMRLALIAVFSSEQMVNIYNSHPNGDTMRFGIVEGLKKFDVLPDKQRQTLLKLLSCVEKSRVVEFK